MFSEMSFINIELRIHSNNVIAHNPSFCYIFIYQNTINIIDKIII